MTVSARTAQRSGSRNGSRTPWRKVHLWLGLTFGLPMFVFGFTGSVLVFWHEIDEALNPQWFRVAESTHHVPLQSALDAAIATAPSGWEGVFMERSAGRGTALQFAFGYSEPRASAVGAESLNVFVDPGNARVVGQRTFYHPWNPLQHSFVGFFFKLHYAFFLGAAGMIVVGIICLLLLASTTSGIVIWWPRSGAWRRALSIKRRASAERLTHDLHQVMAMYPLIVLLAVLVSGLSFNLPEQFAWTVARFSAISPPVQSPAPRRAFVLDAALTDAQRRFPGGRLESLSVVPAPSETVTACYSNVPSLAHLVQDTRCFVLSRRNGALLRVDDAAHGTSGDVFMGWQWPLHSGTVLGWTGRILVFLTGLACCVLPVTGLLRWIQKRRARLEMAGRESRRRGATDAMIAPPADLPHPR